MTTKKENRPIRVRDRPRRRLVFSGELGALCGDDGLEQGSRTPKAAGGAPLRREDVSALDAGR